MSNVNYGGVSQAELKRYQYLQIIPEAVENPGFPKCLKNKSTKAEMPKRLQSIVRDGKAYLYTLPETNIAPENGWLEY